MGVYKIAVIRGDGIGVDVVEEGLKVFNEIAINRGITMDFKEFPWGSQYYFDHGKMMPDDALEELAEFDQIYLGAVGHPELQDHITLNGLLLPIRRAFDQYVCERPSTLHAGVESPLAHKNSGDIDLVVIRENTEGEYANVGGFQYRGFPEEVGIQTSVFTRHGCERVIKYAFELARTRDKKRHVTSVTKSNAQGYGLIVWDEAFTRIAEDYPDIETQSLLVDAACMDFVRKPEEFDVVVASNLFGDILTDIGAIITGSMGTAASANVDPERRYPSMFEPVHGSAPDIAGQGIANPMAAIMSGSMMLRFIGEKDAADSIDAAVLEVLEKGEILTPDLGGTATTAEVGDAIVSLIE